MRHPFSRPFPSVALGFGLILWSLGKYGMGVFPQTGVLFDIARHWQAPATAPVLGPWNDYLLTNASAAILAGMLGLTEPAIYWAFQCAITTLAILLLFVLPAVGAHPERRLLLLLFLAAGPLPAVLLQWIGGYDPLSVIAIALAALARTHLIAAIGWFLLGLNHPTLAIAAWTLCLPMVWYTYPTDAPRSRLLVMALPLVPIALGAGLISYFTHLWGGNTSRVSWLLQMGYDYYLRQYLTALPLVAWSVLGVGWVVLLDPRLRGLTASRALLGTAAITSVIIPLIALDETRVASLALLPALLTFIRSVPIPDGSSLLGPRARWYVAAALMLPTILIFGRNPSIAGWYWLTTLFD